MYIYDKLNDARADGWMGRSDVTAAHRADLDPRGYLLGAGGKPDSEISLIASGEQPGKDRNVAVPLHSVWLRNDPNQLGRPGAFCDMVHRDEWNAAIATLDSGA